MSLDYFLGLDTTDEPSVLFGSIHRHIGGTLEADGVSGIPGLFITARRLNPDRLPEAYEDEGLRAATSLTFTVQAQDPEERSGAMRRMFVAAANLPVDIDCDALLTFGFDIACLRRRGGRLELFSHWNTWREPEVVERLPAGYVLSDEVPRY